MKILYLLFLFTIVSCSDNEGKLISHFSNHLNVYLPTEIELIKRKEYIKFQDYDIVSVYSIEDSTSEIIISNIEKLINENRSNSGWSKCNNGYSFIESDSAHMSEYYIRAWLHKGNRFSILNVHEVKW